MKRLLSAALVALSLPAQAALEPRPCVQGGDPRERCIAHQAGQVIQLYATPGATLVVELPASQSIFDVSVSDNEVITGEPAVQRTGGGNGTGDPNLMVFVPGGSSGPQHFVNIKPLRHLEPQPMVVLAMHRSPSGRQSLRRYTFELRTRPGELTREAQDVYFAVKVTDPAADREEQQARWMAQREQREERAAAARLRQTSLGGAPGVRENRRYEGRGTAEDRAALAPAAGSVPTAAAMWDDGMRTFLRYPGNRRPPMVYGVAPDGTERLVGHHVDADPTTNGLLLVLHGVFPMLRLRDGERVLCLNNQAYDPTGRNPGTGTVDGGVARETVEAPRGRTR
jgi:type IV secretion system protein VirB9